jgi:HPt (histidine-containing phosphotransfer) domain-containing protein
MAASDAQTALSAALDRMWIQYLPLLHERVAILEACAQAFTADQFSTEQQQAAQAAAHKLAGVLGTFGLTRGTVIARELEIMYSRQNGPDPALADRLKSIAAELRTIIDSRK